MERKDIDRLIGFSGSSQAESSLISSYGVDYEGVTSAMKLKEDYPKKPTWYYVVGYIWYVIALLPFAYIITFIEEFDTGSAAYQRFYERETYYTTYFSPGKLIYWLCLAVVGFTFVVVVNLGNVRKNPFTSMNGSYKDVKALIPISFSLFMISAIVFLRGKHDMQRNCEQLDSSFILNAEEKGFTVFDFV